MSDKHKTKLQIKGNVIHETKLGYVTKYANWNCKVKTGCNHQIDASSTEKIGMECY